MVINGFVNAVISSLEQRFGLKSTETGVIAGSYDIGSMLSVIPITYFGGKCFVLEIDASWCVLTRFDTF